MKAKNLPSLTKSLNNAVVLTLFLFIAIAGTTFTANAQKYELTGSKSLITQATEITLSNTTVGKFYYLFRVDDVNEFSYVTMVVGQGFQVHFAPQSSKGKYVVFEFDDYKGMPFDLEKYNPEEGILQRGEVIISGVTNN